MNFFTFQRLVALIFLYSLSSSVNAQSFQSTQTKTQLLELYSSQGCSSCPPAERWVSKQLQHPKLWQDFIPVVFHVDYWDYLGWKDPFSKKSFSQRQRNYYSQSAIGSVYTPGVILDGKEWRNWYRGQSLASSNNSHAGILSASLNNKQLSVSYSKKQNLNLNVALLGFGIKTKITDGENHGKAFTENFIVLEHTTLNSSNGQWELDTKTESTFDTDRYALAIWVNQPDNLQPIQAIGGWIRP